MKEVILAGALLLLGACAPSEPDADESRPSVTPEERAAITEEITQTLDRYIDANMRRDLDDILVFWSDSEDFVFAGDGVILGGYDEWVELVTQLTADTEKWLKWEINNVHVEVLSENAASCTFEFEYAKLTRNGATERLRGAWTYVFKKNGGSWKVIQTNGTHVAF